MLNRFQMLNTMRASDAPLRVGLVGAGRIGRIHAAAVAGSARPYVRLTSVADTNPEAAEALAKQFGAIRISPDELIHRASLDAAIVATPPDTHETLALPLLRRGVSVLCEKPIAHGIQSTRRMVQSGRLGRDAFVVSSKFCFTEGVVAARTMVQTGTIGLPLSLDLNFSRKEDLTKSWFVEPSISGGGILTDRGPQMLDIVRALLGEPVEIRATREAGSKYAVEDQVCVEIKTKSGARAGCTLSWRRTDDSDVYARLRTEKATVELGWQSARLRHDGGEWSSLAPGYDQSRAFSAQFDAFADTIRLGSPFPVELDQSLRNAEAIAAIYASNIDGRRILLARGRDAPIAALRKGCRKRVR